MSILEKRIAALELGSCSVMPKIRIIIFGETTNADDLLGYTCGDVTVHRQEGESNEELQDRLYDLLDWSDPVKTHIAYSIDCDD
jgi:hypothetical protein